MKNKICSVLFTVAVFFFIITFSIGLPIYFRPFYYAHIIPLDLENESGYTYSEIRSAYNEVIDYLTLPCKDFGTGVMEHSESGAAHFKDCKVLFTINAVTFFSSSVIIITLKRLEKAKKLDKLKLGRFSCRFWASVSALGLFALIGLVASVSFYNFFTAFHKLFFPGRDNWYFDPRYDEIINVLPQEFFRNCAILIAASVFVFCAATICREIIMQRKSRKTTGI